VSQNSLDLPLALPGAVAPSESLARALADAWAKRPEGYQPRTQHVGPGGSPRYTNRLLLESSPYLRQHAHNPVNWFPWGEEAFAEARRLDRPVLLSVGYSTCHWCHVMEHESFEDESIARLLNECYVAIKVDREERPDVDAIYMAAVQALHGSGGWPMTVWLAPDQAPFFAGTYFPAHDGDRGCRVGFATLLRELHRLYRHERPKVERQALELCAVVRRLLAPAEPEAVAFERVLEQAAAACRQRFDAEHGGLLGAPKFPSSLPVRFLLRHARRTGDQHALDMAILTLRKMAAGGMYDHLGGGFHRYSTDERWLVPHFEKMLYDNALLSMAYLEGYQFTGDRYFARVARDILGYLASEMTAPDGAFYSATDADSRTPEGDQEEGWFFTWTPGELRAVLDPESSRAIEAYFDVASEGNFEGRSVLYTPRSVDAVAERLGVGVAQLEQRIDSCRRQLYEARRARPAPLLDDKVLVAWNGLAISAFARAARVFPESDYLARAVAAADAVLASRESSGRLFRCVSAGAGRHAATIEDYAFMVAALIDLFEASQDVRWLCTAIELDRVLTEEFRDADTGSYFRASSRAQALLARETSAYDGAEPSGNSVIALNLLRLYELTLREPYRERAEQLVRAFGQQLSGSPLSCAELLLALDFRASSPRQVALVASGGAASLGSLRDSLAARFLPHHVLGVVDEAAPSERQLELLPWLRDKRTLGGAPTAYVCTRGTCQLPVTEPEALLRQL
jgi:hypothetical protein